MRAASSGDMTRRATADMASSVPPYSALMALKNTRGRQAEGMKLNNMQRVFGRPAFIYTARWLMVLHTIESRER